MKRSTYEVTDDPLESIEYLLTPGGRLEALARLEEQRRRGVPINWAAQDALRRAGRGFVANTGYRGADRVRRAGPIREKDDSNGE